MQEIQLKDILARTQNLSEKKVWYVAIIWRPNAGKSTFINTLIGEKIAITSDIPQTTRNKILAIYNDDDSQILFFDTPWIHESQKDFNLQINNQALSSMSEAEVILYFIDSSRPYGTEEKYIEELLKSTQTPVFFVYTKQDLRRQVELREWENVFEISSIHKSGFEKLLEAIKTKLPLGPMLYDADFYTKQDLHFRVSEIVREKLFEELKEELPHSIFVAVEEIQDEWSLKKIAAYIFTETDSQKYIVIGKNGNLLSKVWKAARIELEDIFDQKVFLSLRVKVKKNWRKDGEFVKKMFQ